MFGLLILEITCDIFESGYCQHKNASKYGITGSLFLLFLYITTTSNRINHIPTPAKYLTHMLQKAGFNIFMHKTPSSYWNLWLAERAATKTISNFNFPKHEIQYLRE